MGEEGSGVRAVVVAMVGLIALALGSGLAWPDALQGRGSSTPVDVASLHVSVSSDRVTVTVVGLARGQLARIGSSATGPGRAAAVRLYADDRALTDPTFPQTPIDLLVEDGALVLRPHYPLLPGHEYHIAFERHSAATARPTLSFRVPAKESEAPVVASIHPSADALPENQLKMYVEFTRPMRRRLPYAHISLIDETTGRPVPDAFHALRDGLWDAGGTRLTLVFDPGRVKRGLANHERFGPPLTAGHRYRLVIDAAWPDRNGRPLATSFEKRFVALPPDRAAPDPSRWVIAGPAVGTRDPLVVGFGEPMDHALLERTLSVEGAAGWPVQGTGSVGPDERSWTFVPLRPWPPGEYRIRVDPRIEDLAGNNVHRLFDVDLGVGGSGTDPGIPVPVDDRTGDRPVDLTIPFSVDAGLARIS